MSGHVYFRQELEGNATWWRIFRRDGTALAFTSHDRDLYFSGLVHRAAPGMVPSAIHRTAGLSDDSADMSGALSHDAISGEDLAAGLYDNATVEAGIVNWETLEHTQLFKGSVGKIEASDESYSAQLQSAKAALDYDPVPLASPTCRAQFCGPGCGLSPPKYTHEMIATDSNPDTGQITLSQAPPANVILGEVRWIGGPQPGQRAAILAVQGNQLIVEPAPAGKIAEPARIELREGCDHTIATCADRFGNAANFRGEPFLPGNDLLARYPLPQ